MKTIKYLPLLIEIIFFIAIFILSISPVWDFDVWFHLKSGEIIAKEGIIHHDVFSYVTKDREWFPYEWFFQLSYYFIKHLFGLTFLNYLTSFLATLTIFGLYKLIKNIFKVSTYPALFLGFLFFANSFEFLVPRPQLFAYLCLIATLFLVLNYFFHGKNWLVLTIPLTLIWANSHGSIFLAPLIFLGLSIISLTNKFLLKEKFWLNRFKTLIIYTLVIFSLTILPPLGLTQYRLLSIFFQNRDLITKFISEWAPLFTAPFSFYLFIILASMTFGLFFYTNFRQKSLRENLWVIVFIPLSLSVFLASRNSFLSYLALSLVTASVIPKIKFISLNKKLKVIILSLLLVILLFHVWMISDKRAQAASDQLYYPTGAVKFIKDNQLKGHMFNEYGYGGYLLYELYPNQLVYIDGRTDLYLCCEMPDTLQLAYQKNKPDAEYKQLLDSLWDKNQISFVLLRTEKHVVLRKISRILQDDSNFSLIFWDDNSEIFVRRDGQNDFVIAQFGTVAATPFNKDPFREGQTDKALEEYQKMNSTAPSSKSLNIIGFILLQKGKFVEAKTYFEKAIAIYPYNESPYMNLAELTLKDRDPYQAIKLYEQAKKLAPDRGLIYIRLGQLILETYGDKERTLNTWKEGLQKTVDSEARVTLQKLINNPPEPH